jgi:hypothetical protein
MSWLSHALILRRRSMHSILVGIIAFSLGTASTAFAVMGFQGADNLFHMCAANGGGVRLMSAGETCKPQEAAFDVPSRAYVDAETDARKLADAEMQSQFDGLGNAWKQGDADEAAARQAADSTLQTNLDNETAARKQGDTDTLNSSKQYTDSAVGNEAAARTAGDTTLQSNLDAETAARKQADADEASARKQGDADTLAAANAYTDAHAGGRPALQIISTRVSNPAQLDPGGTLTASVACTGGKVVIGGGANSSNSNVVLFQSFPSSTLQWTATARAVGTVAPFGAGLTVYAICMG